MIIFIFFRNLCAMCWVVQMWKFPIQYKEKEAKRNAKEFVHEFVALLLSLPIREYWHLVAKM